MSCNENKVLLDQLYEVALEEGYPAEKAQELAKERFENWDKYRIETQCYYLNKANKKPLWKEADYTLVPISKEELDAIAGNS